MILGVILTLFCQKLDKENLIKSYRFSGFDSIFNFENLHKKFILPKVSKKQPLTYFLASDSYMLFLGQVLAEVMKLNTRIVAFLL